MEIHFALVVKYQCVMRKAVFQLVKTGQKSSKTSEDTKVLLSYCSGWCLRPMGAESPQSYEEVQLSFPSMSWHCFFFPAS